MLLQIISHTPTWVFVLFAALVAMGVAQTRARTASLTRVTVLPLVMVGLAASGVWSAFGHHARGLWALVVWGKAALVTGFVVASRPVAPGTSYDPVRKQFNLPGSVVPLVMMMSIFLVKYAVGVSIAIHPELTQQTAFALAISAVYGVFSGIFVARTVRLWKMGVWPASGLVAA